MTKKEAIAILIQYVEGDIIAGNFWDDPAYEKEIQAINTLKETK